jgi:hypothetical protein
MVNITHCHMHLVVIYWPAKSIQPLSHACDAVTVPSQRSEWSYITLIIALTLWILHLLAADVFWLSMIIEYPCMERSDLHWGSLYTVCSGTLHYHTSAPDLGQLADKSASEGWDKIDYKCWCDLVMVNSWIHEWHSCQSCKNNYSLYFTSSRRCVHFDLSSVGVDLTEWTYSHSIMTGYSVFSSMYLSSVNDQCSLHIILIVCRNTPKI